MANTNTQNKADLRDNLTHLDEKTREMYLRTCSENASHYTTLYSKMDTESFRESKLPGICVLCNKRNSASATNSETGHRICAGIVGDCYMCILFSVYLA